MKSWNVKEETQLKAQLDKAQEHLNTAMALSKNNPELMVMQGQIYTNWIAFDGRTYGMKYSVKDKVSYTNSRLQIKLNTFNEQDIIVARERVKDFKNWLE